MLIITRAIGEGFSIGNDIRVVLLSPSSSGETRIGIEAPKEMIILRDELEKTDFKKESEK